MEKNEVRENERERLFVVYLSICLLSKRTKDLRVYSPSIDCLFPTIPLPPRTSAALPVLLPQKKTPPEGDAVFSFRVGLVGSEDVIHLIRDYDLRLVAIVSAE